MIGSSHVENLVIESVLAGNFSIVNEPLVAVFVNGGVGHGVAMEGSLKEVEVGRGNYDKKNFIKLG